MVQPTLRRPRFGPARWAALAGVLLALGLVSPAAASVPAGPGRTSPDVVRSTALVTALAAAPDPAGRFAALAVSDQHAVISYLSVASYATSHVLGRQAQRPRPDELALDGQRFAAALSGPGAGCWTWKWERDAYNLFGLKLWAYFQQIDWCDDGYVIVGAPQVVNYGSTTFPFWTWLHAGDHLWGGAGQPSFRSWTQADFSLCLSPNIGCIQSTYPWLDMTARANGTATGSVG